MARPLTPKQIEGLGAVMAAEITRATTNRKLANPNLPKRLVASLMERGMIRSYAVEIRDRLGHYSVSLLALTDVGRIAYGEACGQDGDAPHA